MFVNQVKNFNKKKCKNYKKKITSVFVNQVKTRSYFNKINMIKKCKNYKKKTHDKKKKTHTLEYEIERKKKV